MSPNHRLSNPTNWVDEHGDYLFRYAMFRLRDSVAAEDVLQETLLAAMKGRANFRGVSSERTWLVGILRHKILDRFRELSRLQPLNKAEDAIDDLILRRMVTGDPLQPH